MSAAKLDRLREQVRGRVTAPGTRGTTRPAGVFNGMIDKRPAVVVRAETAGDVVAAVNFARDAGLDLAVRGGGHSVPGFGTVDDGVVIDLSGMRGVEVDAGAKTARVAGRGDVG